MLKKLFSWIHNMASEVDNKTICPVRTTALGGTTYAFFCHGWTTFVNHVPFDMLTFSAGLSSILVTLGAACAIKTDSPIKKDGE